MSGHGGKRQGAGRPKGSFSPENKMLKDIILTALHKVGNEEYLARQAEENPSAFMSLIGRVLPMTVQGDDKGGPIKVSISWDED